MAQLEKSICSNWQDVDDLLSKYRKIEADVLSSKLETRLEVKRIRDKAKLQLELLQDKQTYISNEIKKFVEDNQCELIEINKKSKYLVHGRVGYRYNRKLDFKIDQMKLVDKLNEKGMIDYIDKSLRESANKKKLRRLEDNELADLEINCSVSEDFFVSTKQGKIREDGFYE